VTGLYYAQARYYEPRGGRFISEDGARDGLNWYAYCNSNPMRYIDPSGLIYMPPVYIPSPELMYRGIRAVGKAYITIDATVNTVKDITNSVANDIREDLVNFNWSNTEPEVIAEAKRLSSYKGQLVIKHNIEQLPRAGAFGAIFLPSYKSDEYWKSQEFVDTLDHEWSHNIQLQELGVLIYTFGIFIPSAMSGGLSNDIYYKRPWEASADNIGGVTRDSHTDKDIILGLLYYEALLSLRNPFSIRNNISKIVKLFNDINDLFGSNK
jgi:uncharacterized protein RhaS with RHS repeats